MGALSRAMPPSLRAADTREPAGGTRTPSLHLHGSGLRRPFPGPGMPRVGRDGAAAGRPLRRWTSRSHPRGRGASGTPRSPDGHVLRPRVRASRGGHPAGITVSGRYPSRMFPCRVGLLRLPRRAHSTGSPRPSYSSVAAKGCASTATSPTRPATSARDSSTWRLQTTLRRTPSPPTWPPQLSRRCLTLVDHLEEFSQRFPTLQLEDELFVQAGRSVMTGILGA